MYSSTTEGISAGANAWRSISLCIGIRTGSDMSARRALTRPGGLRPRGPPTPSLAGPHDPRSARAGAPVARLARYAARPQRVQNSRCEPHNGLTDPIRPVWPTPACPRGQPVHSLTCPARRTRPTRPLDLHDVLDLQDLLDPSCPCPTNPCPYLPPVPYLLHLPCLLHLPHLCPSCPSCPSRPTATIAWPAAPCGPVPESPAVPSPASPPLPIPAARR